jgi:Icc-related predicted phosphoesterase
MVTIAGAGDLHIGLDSAGTLEPILQGLNGSADVLLIAGDLTRLGDPSEAQVLAEEIKDLTIPTFAVLGNHDHHKGAQDEIRNIIEDSGIRVLEGEAAVVQVDGVRVGIAGIKGFCGGFFGACGTEFGEIEMKSFVGHTRKCAEALEAALSSLEADLRIVLLHFSPVEQTLEGERLEIYPFLGSYLLAEAIDRVGADLVLHGHSHRGKEKGATPGGIPVRNVAQPVLGSPYALFRFGEDFGGPIPRSPEGIARDRSEQFGWRTALPESARAPTLMAEPKKQGLAAKKDPDVTEETFLRVLDQAVEALERKSITHMLIGGIPAAYYGLPRWSHRGEDIDLLVKPEEANRALASLAEAGFDTEKTDPNWIFKAVRKGVMVDLIFRVMDSQYLDDEMLDRSGVEQFHGRTLRMVSPDDLVIMLALSNEEQIPQHWENALGIVAYSNLDWRYLVKRGREAGPWRVLSLLSYALSNDLLVPRRAIAELARAVDLPLQVTNELPG